LDTLEQPFKISWGLWQNRRAVYYFGYKNIIFTLKLKAAMFCLQFILSLYFYICFMRHEYKS